MPPSETDVFNAVGMTFLDNYPASAYRMQGMLEAGRQRMWTTAWREGDEAPDGTNGADRIRPEDYPVLTAFLVREPHNRKDRNAIAIYVPALGRGEAGRIGHVPRKEAKRLANSIDQGVAYSAAVTEILGAEDTENPGIQIEVWAVPST